MVATPKIYVPVWIILVNTNKLKPFHTYLIGTEYSLNINAKISQYSVSWRQALITVKMASRRVQKHQQLFH